MTVRRRGPGFGRGGHLESLGSRERFTTTRVESCQHSRSYSTPDSNHADWSTFTTVRFGNLSFIWPSTRTFASRFWFHHWYAKEHIYLKQTNENMSNAAQNFPASQSMETSTAGYWLCHLPPPNAVNRSPVSPRSHLHAPLTPHF